MQRWYAANFNHSQARQAIYECLNRRKSAKRVCSGKCVSEHKTN